jgi:hypothetical protein
MERDGILETAMFAYEQMVREREEELRRKEEEYQASLLLMRQKSMRETLKKLYVKYPLTDIRSNFPDIQEDIDKAFQLAHSHGG